MRRIFISHSTERSDAAAVEFLLAVQKGLAEDGKFEVFLDVASIDGGESWLTKINNQLVYCDAAVLILSSRALASDFVHYEVSNFMSRRRLSRDPNTDQPRFPFIPLIPLHPGQDEPAARQQIDAGLADGFWEKIFFSKELQIIGPFTAAKAVAELLKLFEQLPPESPTTPLKVVEENVSELLSDVRWKFFERAAQAAGFEVPAPGLSQEAAADYVARQLLLCSMIGLHRALSKLQAPLNKKVLSVFHLVAPSWVSLEAAQELLEELKKARKNDRPDASGVWVMVNGSVPDFTPRMYVQRALGGWKANTRGVFLLGSATISALHVKEEIQHRLNRACQDHLLNGSWTVDDPNFAAQLQEKIDTYWETEKPVVVVVELADFPDVTSRTSYVSALFDLSKTDPFRRVVFFVLSDRGPFEASLGVKELSPMLPHKKDERIFLFYNEIAKDLEENMNI